MTHGDVARILAAAAARDSRSVGDADILAWHEDIGDLAFTDALEAVSAHYRESTDRIMPAHVRQLAKRIRDERRRVEQHHEVRALPSRFEDDVTRNLRVKEGVAQCRDVLSAVMARLEAARGDDQANPHYAGPPPPDGHPVPEPDPPQEP
jgi:hypothetical protein